MRETAAEQGSAVGSRPVQQVMLLGCWRRVKRGLANGES